MPPLRPPIPRAPGIPWIVFGLMAAGLLVVGSRLGLATSTETRYAEIGREMYVSGDWVIPTMNGAPHLEKPPFTYWALAAAYALAGVNDVAARLPGLLAGALTLLVIGGVVRRLAPPDDPDPRGLAPACLWRRRSPRSWSCRTRSPPTRGSSSRRPPPARRSSRGSARTAGPVSAPSSASTPPWGSACS
jgi:hypothetical protein